MTCCRCLVVALSLRIREEMSSSLALACRVNSKNIDIGSDCSFAKSTTYKSESHRSFGYGLKTEAPCRYRFST
jgi:hypothetical protein